MTPRARASIAALATLLFAFSARADDAEVSSPERAVLETASTLTYRTIIERGERRAVGGIVYALMAAPPARTWAALRSRQDFVHFFPHLRSARIVGEVPPDLFMEFEYGSSGFHTVHTMSLRYDDASRTVRFWLDPRFPHGVHDAWGYFRVVEDPNDPQRSILVYGALLDLGLGIFDIAVEDRVQSALLSVPSRLQRFLRR